MKIAIIGTGYVGLVTGACLAQAGMQVTCLDKDVGKIDLLRHGTVPIHEPGLQELIAQGSARGTLRFESMAQSDAALREAAAIFLAIGTPTGTDGRARLTDLLDCASHLGRVLPKGGLVVVKSTVPVGTCERIRSLLETPFPGAARRFVVASNPEFLAEGRAIADFQRPERIVIGCDDPDAGRLLRALYAPFDPDGSRTMMMDVRSAEYAKYACNATLAARISMVNELACIAGQMGVDMRSVCKVLKSDPRIGPHYLQPGAGYGGSCLPKDLRALITMAQDHGEPAYMLHSVETVNAGQGRRLLDALTASLAYDLQDKRIALWGLTFKADTDDLREAPSLTLARSLLEAGARVQAYDPVAGPAASALIADPGFQVCADAYEACEDADALVVMTDWAEFRQADLSRVARELNGTLVFDCRNLYESARLRGHGLVHLEVGQRPLIAVQPRRDALHDAI